MNYSRLAVAFVATMFCQSAFAVPPLWEPNYEVTELNGTAGGASSGGAPSGQIDGQENVALGFNFPFAGVNYNRIIVDSDGAILLTNGATVKNLPSTTWNKINFQGNFTNVGSGSASPAIFPFNSALDQSTTGGEVWYASYNGSFNGFNGFRGVITWERSTVKVFNSTADLTFQVILLDDGTIIFNYQTLTSPSGANWHTKSDSGIVVGISNGDGTWGLGSQNFSGPTFGIDLTGYQIWCKNDNSNNPTDCVQPGLGKNNTFDLNNKSIVFNRDGNTGFMITNNKIEDGTGKGGSDKCAVSGRSEMSGSKLAGKTQLACVTPASAGLDRS